MYGDKFVILSRYTLVARGPSSCTLHLAYCIVFHPSVNFMMRPMVQKGVDGEWRPHSRRMRAPAGGGGGHICAARERAAHVRGDDMHGTFDMRHTSWRATLPSGVPQ